MKLPEVIAALEAEMPAHAGWRVAVLTRDRDEATEDEQGVQEFRVLKFLVDDADRDINLVTNEDAPPGSPKLAGMTLGELLNGLLKLAEACGDFSVYSRSAEIPIDGEYNAQLDCPLVGVAMNPDTEVFGFLQWPPDQWQGFTAGN
jgi:hypothetical protein